MVKRGLDEPSLPVMEITLAGEQSLTKDLLRVLEKLALYELALLRHQDFLYHGWRGHEMNIVDAKVDTDHVRVLVNPAQVLDQEGVRWDHGDRRGFHPLDGGRSLVSASLHVWISSQRHTSSVLQVVFMTSRAAGPRL